MFGRKKSDPQNEARERLEQELAKLRQIHEKGLEQKREQWLGERNPLLKEGFDLSERLANAKSTSEARTLMSLFINCNKRIVESITPSLTKWLIINASLTYLEKETQNSLFFSKEVKSTALFNEAMEKNTLFIEFAVKFSDEQFLTEVKKCTSDDNGFNNEIKKAITIVEDRFFKKNQERGALANNVATLAGVGFTLHSLYARPQFGVPLLLVGLVAANYRLLPFVNESLNYIVEWFGTNKPNENDSRRGLNPSLM